MTVDLQDEVEDVLGELRNTWNRMALPDIARLWETENPTPVYIPEESLEPLLDWESITAYWQDTVATISGLHMRTWDLSVRAINSDLVSAVYQMHWDAKLAGTGTTMGGRNRVCALLRRSSRGLRFIQYVEAPLAPMVYMRWLYERAVDHEFAERKE
jgi:hypothetical protein